MDTARRPTAHHTVTGWPGSGRPAHAERPWRPPARSTIVGGLLLLGALGLAGAAFLQSVGSSKSTPTSASLITVSPAPTSAPA